METFRTYGNPPYHVVVVHGGPGAAGEMAPVARELSQRYGVLEPLQTATTLDGQLEELQDVLLTRGNPPVTLIGHSWGAMLGFLFTVQNPHLVKRLILVASGVFDSAYASVIEKTRLNRLTRDERAELRFLAGPLAIPGTDGKDALYRSYGKILERADSFDLLFDTPEVIRYDYAAFEGAWREMERIRASGELIACGSQITCPVLAIHGDYDPHPADGVRIPLTPAVRDFRFVLLERCGHYPWRERYARERFYDILSTELEQP